MAADKDNPFFLEAGLDVSELEKSVTKAEKFYQTFSKSMEDAVEGLESQEEQYKKTGEAAQESAQEQERASNKSKRVLADRFNIIKKIGGGIGGIFKREKMAVESLGISWSSLAALIGGATVVGLIGKVIKDWLEFDGILREVNVTMSSSPRLMREASANIQELTGYLNTSREELSSMMKTFGELHIIQGNTEEAAKAFRQLTLDTIHLSKSMDVSTDSVTGMFDKFTRIYKLPHHRLRNIAASMKFIQEQTSISGQELVSFGEGLEDILSRMLRVTGAGREQATVDLMAMAGVLKDMGVQPEKVSQMFGEAMKIHSEQGAQFLSLITEGTDKTAEQVRKMMQAGDFQTPLTLLIERIKKESPEWLEHNEEWLAETTGLTFAELRNIQQASSEGLRDIFERNRKEYLRGQKHAEEAAKRQHKLSKLWNDLKRVAERVWLSIGSVFVEVATQVSAKLVPAIESMVEKFRNWINSSEGVAAIEMWTRTLINLFGSLASWIGKKIPTALAAMGSFWDKYLKDKFAWLLTPQGGEAVKAWFSDALGSIKIMAKGIKEIAQVIFDVREALRTDEEKMTDYTTEQVNMLEKSRKSFEKHIAQRLKEGGKFEYAGIEMEATPGNIQTFMAKVAKKQTQDFIKGLNRYEATTGSELKAKRASLKRFGTELLAQQKRGFGPDFDFLQRFAPGARALSAKGEAITPGEGTGVFAAPPTVNTKIPPTTVKKPEVEVTVEKQSPLKVSVKTESATTERLLLGINDTLNRILVSNRGHASRVLLQQQQG